MKNKLFLLSITLLLLNPAFADQKVDSTQQEKEVVEAPIEAKAPSTQKGDQDVPAAPTANPPPSRPAPRPRPAAPKPSGA